MNQAKIDIYIYKIMALTVSSKSIKTEVISLLQYIRFLSESYPSAIGEDLKEVEERILKTKLQIKNIINGKK